MAGRSLMQSPRVLLHSELSPVGVSADLLPFIMASGRITGTLSLKRFMLRSEVLRLYRDMLRVVRRVPCSEQRKDLQQWIRTDFENNKHHTDEAVISMMITKGRMSLKELDQTLSLVS